MKRPRKPGIYRFTPNEKFTLPLVNEWMVGIVFLKTGLRKEEGRWCFYGTSGNHQGAYSFAWPLAPFVGNGDFTFLGGEVAK